MHNRRIISQYEGPTECLSNIFIVEKNGDDNIVNSRAPMNESFNSRFREKSIIRFPKKFNNFVIA